MRKSKILAIVPKNNHNQLTCWCFDIKDIELANKTLNEYYPDGTHEVIETDCEEFESAFEFETWCLKHHTY